MTDTPLVTRRTVLAGAGAGVGVAVVLGSAGGADAQRRYFQHGVASGDPRPDRVVLWTRVTPTAASRPGSRKGPRATVSWAVSTDPAFKNVVSSGQVVTGPSVDHTVKVEAADLEPATSYFYRFAYDGNRSRVGRTRTAPATDAMPENLRLGMVSCADLQAGWFSVYRHLADRDDLDAVVHLGDYFYEYGAGHRPEEPNVRNHRPRHETVSLADYRKRHAQYKGDADLQQLHARYPVIAVWDDHELANNSWKGGARNHQPKREGSFSLRAKRARRAYDEWMPTALSGTAVTGDGQQIYRSFQFGQLAELSMLDLRSYRSKQVDDLDGPVDDPRRTITGKAQMRWLKRQLTATRTQWKLVGNPTMMAPVVRPSVPEPVERALDAMTGVPRAAPSSQPEPFSLDAWSGYRDDQREVVEHIDSRGVTDVVFLTGDVHSEWANEVPLDASTYPKSPSVATEFICTSVTANNLSDREGGDGMSNAKLEAEFRARNPFVRRVNLDNHGYCVVDVTAERAQVDWYRISDRTKENASSSWEASFATDAGTQTIRSAPAPVG